jgi:dTDP-glucose pyrophosphorylase
LGGHIGKGNQMNIIMGLCGEGSRFKNVGHVLPKYLIVYHGAPMIYHAVETIKIPGRIHFVVREDHLHEHKHLEKLLLGLGHEIIVCKGKTQGAAESLLLAKSHIQNLNNPMISVNCDQYLSWHPFNLVDEMQRNPETSYIVTYNETSPKCSYVREKNNHIVEVREKKVISNDATIGIYHWAHTRDFFQDAESMIADNHRENGEYYIAPVYNYSISRGLDVRKFAIDNTQFWPVGTPDDYSHFLQNNPDFD